MVDDAIERPQALKHSQEAILDAEKAEFEKLFSQENDGFHVNIFGFHTHFV